ncbi:HvfC/BufC family peptide modification chaperone [Dyella sp. 2RAB6]|uniref:HvfC/BufC family peptide modification chaperone n=1 Tax=Dyella sp. 2RAB6 TaxID=3232992 RepID=UPI003F8F7E1A
MSDLQALQLRLQRAVMGASAMPLPELVGDGIADARSRLAIYRHGYRARLREALSNEFPTVASLAGRRFTALLDRYIDACPSEHYNLRWHGAGLAAFLRYALPWRDRPAFAEAAELDWAISTCFDAADEPALGADALAAIAPQDWAGLHLVPQQHLQWLALVTNVDAFRTAVDAGAPRPHLRRRAQPRRLIVWRQAHTVRYRPLGLDECQLLWAATRDEPFSRLCELAQTQRAPQQALARLATMLHGWIDAGLIRELRPTDG